MLRGLDWKLVGAAFIVLFVVLSLVAWNPFQTKMIGASFSPSGTLAPGQSTILKVEITNTLDKDATSGNLSVRPINPEAVTLGTYKQLLFPIGKGDRQTIEVPVTVSTTALEGTYSLEVAVGLDGKKEAVRAAIEVKS